MDITLDDLEVIATLGVGGFGRVELVKVMMMMVITYSNTINWKKYLIAVSQPTKHSVCSQVSQKAGSFFSSSLMISF